MEKIPTEGRYKKVYREGNTTITKIYLDGKLNMKTSVTKIGGMVIETLKKVVYPDYTFSDHKMIYKNLRKLYGGGLEINTTMDDIVTDVGKSPAISGDGLEIHFTNGVFVSIRSINTVIEADGDRVKMVNDKSTNYLKTDPDVLPFIQISLDLSMRFAVHKGKLYDTRSLGSIKPRDNATYKKVVQMHKIESVYRHEKIYLSFAHFGFFHREDGPALIKNKRISDEGWCHDKSEQRWFINGKLHNECGPAVIKTEKRTDHELETTHKYYINGSYRSGDEPYEIKYQGDIITHEYWRRAEGAEDDYLPDRVNHKERAVYYNYNTSSRMYEMYERLLILKKELDEAHEYIEHLTFAPGGPGFAEAADHFNSQLANQ